MGPPFLLAKGRGRYLTRAAGFVRVLIGFEAFIASPREVDAGQFPTALPFREAE
jgi:hypothetical protein